MQTRFLPLITPEQEDERKKNQFEDAFFCVPLFFRFDEINSITIASVCFIPSLLAIFVLFSLDYNHNVQETSLYFMNKQSNKDEISNDTLDLRKKGMKQCNEKAFHQIWIYSSAYNEHTLLDKTWSSCCLLRFNKNFSFI